MISYSILEKFPEINHLNLAVRRFGNAGVHLSVKLRELNANASNDLRKMIKSAQVQST